MKHLEDEDIGKMIEGTISKKERENFLKHLSECSTCFEVYTDTLKFTMKERKPKIKERLFNSPGILFCRSYVRGLKIRDMYWYRLLLY
jgi:hypothetical protein